MPPTYPAGSYPALVVADGATAYWRLGETSGTTAVDVIGGANGTISGGVTLGQAGALADGDKAMVFDGTNGRILSANISLAVPITLECWFKTTATVATNPMLDMFLWPYGSASGDDAFNVRIAALGEVRFVSYLTTDTFYTSVVQRTGLNDGQWHHLALVLLGSSGVAYVDGATVATDQPLRWNQFTDKSFGIAWNADPAIYFNGTLDDVAIYPTALSPTQIAAHYAARTWEPFVLEKALTYARSGMARSGATRSNYVSVLTSIDWIIRDSAGTITEIRDLSNLILLNSLTITQALHDEADTCSFSITPNVGTGSWPAVGSEIRVSWAPGGGAGTVLFHGFALIVQQDWRMGNLQGPWGNVQCQDAMWRFDARLVTYRFPNQSVTASIDFLVRYFCNLSPTEANPLDFTIGFVQQNMPVIPAFDVVNQRPSTVLRTLTNAVAGGFYLEGFALHAWANSLTEPNQTNPQPLTVGLSTLKAFRLTTDATQLRRRVLVEGKRSTTLYSFPTVTTAESIGLGVSLSDSQPFLGGDLIARIGSQWMQISNVASVTAGGINPPQTQTASAFDPASGLNQVALKPMPMLPPPYGWVRVGNQYARYGSYDGDPLTGVWQLNIAGPAYPYGRFTVPIPADETVEWVDGMANMATAPINWRSIVVEPTPDWPANTRAASVNTAVVTLAMAQAPLSAAWPDLEAFVQDGRYSYAGAQARAEADLAAFRDPLTSLDWETEDMNAIPGRAQVVAMSSETIDYSDTVTILRVDLAFPLRTLPPRRRCSGGTLKPTSFLDLVVTSTD
jgi:Concanavalin A-like lectin/glucanases superfamily